MLGDDVETRHGTSLQPCHGASLQRAETNEPQFEIIDGQQRTISICQYVNGDFAFDFRYFHNLQPDEQEQ